MCGAFWVHVPRPPFGCVASGSQSSMAFQPNTLALSILSSWGSTSSKHGSSADFCFNPKKSWQDLCQKWILRCFFQNTQSKINQIFQLAEKKRKWMTRPSFIWSHIRKAWKIIKFMQNLEDFPYYLIYSLFSVSVDINHLVFWFPDVQFMGQPAGFRLNMLNRSIAITKAFKIRRFLKHREFEALYGWSTLQTNMEKPYGNWGANLPVFLSISARISGRRRGRRMISASNICVAPWNIPDIPPPKKK